MTWRSMLIRSWWILIPAVIAVGIVWWWDALRHSTGLTTPALLLLGVPVIAGFAIAVVILRAIQAHLRAERPDKPLITLGSLFVVGALLSLWYGYDGPHGSFAQGVLLVAVMTAAIAVGGLLGFLFGIPRFDYGQKATGAVTGAATVPADPKTRLSLARYRPSTNLDDVADWLTKLIVGIALSQIVNVGPAITSIATAILAPCGNQCAVQRGYVSALVTAGAIGGFLFAYIWTRLRYGKLAAESDVATQHELDAFTASDYGVGKPPAAGRFEVWRGGLPGGNQYIVDPDSTEPTVDVSADDDPNQNRFGGRSNRNGRVLRGTIEPSELGPGLYRVTLSVRSLTLSDPLQGSVIFHLHPTFREPVVTRPVENGIAELTVISYGAFTVGALADNARTMLELDLATLPDATPNFRAH